MLSGLSFKALSPGGLWSSLLKKGSFQLSAPPPPLFHPLTSRFYHLGRHLSPSHLTNHPYVTLSHSSSSQVSPYRATSSFSSQHKYLWSRPVSIPLPCFIYHPALTAVWNYLFVYLCIVNPSSPISVGPLGSLISPAHSTVLTHSRYSLDSCSKSLKSWWNIPKLRCFCLFVFVCVFFASQSL